MEEKKCPACQVVKPIVDFSRHPDGRQTYCKPCFREREKELLLRLYGDTREYHLRSRYGVSAARIKEVALQLKGLCAICGDESPDQVDHDHATGRLRGLLCDGCNGGLGAFHERIDLLERAIEYLERRSV